MRALGRALLACAVWVSLSGLPACTRLMFFAANAPSALAPVRRLADRPYGADPRQRLDVYLPRSAGPRPIVVFWYGGSWTFGSKSDYRFVGTALAERGFVAVLPDYRLFPQVRFPQFMLDGAAAVAWVRQHARELGADPERIVLMGHSAGAHMAALLALDTDYLAQAGVPAASIVGLVGLSGPYALDPNSATLHAIFGPPFTDAQWQPVQFVSERSPPALLLQGLADSVVYPSHTQKLCAALSAHQIWVQADLYPRRGHADTVASFAVLARWRTPALAQTIAFLDEVTAPRGDGPRVSECPRTDPLR